MSDAKEDGSRPSDHGEEEGEDEEQMRKRHNKETRVSVGVHVGSIGHASCHGAWWWGGEVAHVHGTDLIVPALTLPCFYDSLCCWENEWGSRWRARRGRC